MRAITGIDSRAQTAHDLAARSDPERLPARVARLLIERGTQSVQSRRAEYRDWQTQERERHASHDHDTDQHRSSHRDQCMDYGLDL